MGMLTFRKKSAKAKDAVQSLPSLSVTRAGGATGEDPALAAPDTRMLRNLGGCATTVHTTVETVDDRVLASVGGGLRSPRTPTFDFSRRPSSASALSAASINLVTPTYPTEAPWSQPSYANPKDEVRRRPSPLGSRQKAIAEEDEERDMFFSSAFSSAGFSHAGFSERDEYDISKLHALVGVETTASDCPFGFETLGKKGMDFPNRSRPVDAEDFYVPMFSKANPNGGFVKHKPGTRRGQ